VVIGDGFFTQLRERAPRLVGRIAQARSVGQAVVDLSVAELRAVADVVAIIADKCRPLPKPSAGWGSWRRRPGRIGRVRW
jgi:hypothetical protein